MINLEYHKDSLCLYKSVICQEGQCSGCAINQEHSAGIDDKHMPQSDCSNECTMIDNNFYPERTEKSVRKHPLILIVDDDQI